MKKTIILMAMGMILAGCQGGGDSGSGDNSGNSGYVAPTEKQSPKVSITSKTTEVTVNRPITLTAIDKDGTIVSYEWSEQVGDVKMLRGDYTSKTYIYTPTTIGTHTITLIVKNNKYEEGKTNIDIKVNQYTPTIKKIASSDTNTTEVNTTISLGNEPKDVYLVISNGGPAYTPTINN